MGRNKKNLIFLMKTILLLTVIASMVMLNRAMTDQRRMALTRDYQHARRMGFKFPQQFCKPAHDAGVFILDTTVMCAVEALIPGAGNIAKAIKAGKKIADKLGVMKKINELKSKAEKFIVGKFLGIFGCKFRRRVFSFGSIGKAISHAAHSVAHVASNAAHAVGNAAKSVGKGLASAGKFVVKNIGAIAKVICPVVKPMCKPACGAALTLFKAAGTTLAATFHIPLGCLSDALGKACNQLCDAICHRRRLRVHKKKGGKAGKKAKK